MNKTLLDNWKNSDLIGLNRRLSNLESEKSLYDWKLKSVKEEMEVISYYIGLREGQTNSSKEIDE